MFCLVVLLCLTHFTVGGTISGQVFLRGEDSSLSTQLTGCVLNVEVRDTSLQDGPAPLLGSNQYSTITSFPISYSVAYTPDRPPKPFYSIYARITCSDGHHYFNTESTQVNPEENGDIIINITVDSVN